MEPFFVIFFERKRSGGILRRYFIRVMVLRQREFPVDGGKSERQDDTDAHGPFIGDAESVETDKDNGAADRSRGIKIDARPQHVGDGAQQNVADDAAGHTGDDTHHDRVDIVRSEFQGFPGAQRGKERHGKGIRDVQQFPVLEPGQPCQEERDQTGDQDGDGKGGRVYPPHTGVQTEVTDGAAAHGRDKAQNQDAEDIDFFGAGRQHTGNGGCDSAKMFQRRGMTQRAFQQIQRLLGV